MADLDPKVGGRKIIFKSQKEVTLPGVWRGKPESETIESDRLEGSAKISFPEKKWEGFKAEGTGSLVTSSHSGASLFLSSFGFMSLFS